LALEAVGLKVLAGWTKKARAIGRKTSKFANCGDFRYRLGEPRRQARRLFEAVALIGLSGLPHLFDQLLAAIGRGVGGSSANSGRHIAWHLRGHARGGASLTAFVRGDLVFEENPFVLRARPCRWLAAG
jgi:hypothetical protein